MRITLRQLEIFEKVADTSSYTRAAELLYLSQPAVSMQIRQLGEQVGLPLFEMIGKKIFLTDAGREFRYYSRSILALMEEADVSMQALRGIHKGKLKIAITSAANHFVVKLLTQFQRRHASVQFECEVAHRERLLERIDSNEVDMIIIGQAPERDDLVITPFLKNPIVFIAPPGHPFARQKRIAVEALRGEPVIARENKSGMHLALENFYAKYNVKMQIEHVFNDAETVKQAVRSGLGISLCSFHTIGNELKDGALVVLDIVNTPIERTWSFVYCKGKRLSPLLQAFQRCILEHSKSLDCKLSASDVA